MTVGISYKFGGLAGAPLMRCVQAICSQGEQPIYPFQLPNTPRAASG